MKMVLDKQKQELRLFSFPATSNLLEDESIFLAIVVLSLLKTTFQDIVPSDDS